MLTPKVNFFFVPAAAGVGLGAGAGAAGFVAAGSVADVTGAFFAAAAASGVDSEQLELHRLIVARNRIESCVFIGSTRLANEHCQWFDEGISCEILDLATRRWCKGKVRVNVSVEFYVEDSGEKMLLPGDRGGSGERQDISTDLSSDEYVTSEYVFSGIHHNNH